MKKLIIVGSAPLDKDYSNLIDGADCVMRFNDCKNYNQNSGTKTDVLVLNNTGDPVKSKTLSFMLENRNRQQLKEQLPYANETKEVWFVRPNPVFLKNFLRVGINKGNRILDQEFDDIDENRNISVEIIKAQKLESKKIKFMTTDLYLKLWESLKRYGTSRGVVPSTGILGIVMLLEDPSFSNYEKYIMGFTFQGWEGHTWMQEKCLVENLLNSGQLKLI